MQRGAGRDARSGPPGIFETIAAAMSALLVQPLPLVVPIALDLYLSGGARLSPAPVVDPLRRWLARQDGADAAGLVDGLERLARNGDLATVAAAFLPSLLVDGAAAGNVPWQRPSVDLGGSAVTLLSAVGLLGLGIWGAMAFGTMLARLAKGRAPLGDRFLRASGLATIRYVGFLALFALATAAVVVPLAIVGAVFEVVGLTALVGLVVAALVVPAIAAYVLLAFVGEAIVVAEVGPLRACSLSFGVVRRNPWPTIGLLLVLLIGSAAVARLGGQLAGSLPGLLLAVVAYAFVATGLALARIQFFADRLRRWRADLVPPPMPMT
ncbi:MAG: hypothetical protein AVDCRST_MAG19-2857 [uncultured Thermomicrobiales bacterium]|uniref:DUF7847 domain-containing protein n=1 Tax=uncultured Thermomicrobiales bacterium TaxID=1645740 RepID=A0A6J4V8M4_9BACT|nr:MAG: hypothetical protein AVDCRST_MAG19-2857 [uncultured Thermomicrobiales bacterium]